MVAKKEPEKQTERKKRGNYAQKECPYCHKFFGNVQNHIKMVHPTEAEAEGRPVDPPPVSKESLLGDPPPREPKPEDKIYYCQSCRARLRKGETTCWHCGAVLVWEGL